MKNGKRGRKNVEFISVGDEVGQASDKPISTLEQPHAHIESITSPPA